MARPQSSAGRTSTRLGSSRPPLPQFGQFVLVGLTGVVVNLIVFSLVLAAFTGNVVFDLIGSLTRASTQSGVSVVDILAASAVAFVVATLWNFMLNSLWTFRTSRGHYHSALRRLVLYYLVSLISLGVNELVLFGLTTTLPPLYAQAAGIAAGSIVGFVGNRRFTFLEAASSVPSSRKLAVPPTDPPALDEPGPR